MAASVPIELAFSSANDSCIYVVFRPLIWNEDAQLFAFEKEDGTAGWYCAYGADQGELKVYDRERAATITITGVTVNEWHILRVYWTAGEISVRLDDEDAQSDDTAVAIIDIDHFAVGAGVVNTAATSSVDVAGFMFYYITNLTDDFETSVKQYLTNYFFGAIPLGMTFDPGGPWEDNDPL